MVSTTVLLSSYDETSSFWLASSRYFKGYNLLLLRNSDAGYHFIGAQQSNVGSVIFITTLFLNALLSFKWIVPLLSFSFLAICEPIYELPLLLDGMFFYTKLNPKQ